jgi:thiamine kinase-like enzyme
MSIAVFVKKYIRDFLTKIYIGIIIGIPFYKIEKMRHINRYYSSVIIVWTKEVVYKLDFSKRSLKYDINNRKKVFHNKYPASDMWIVRNSPLIIGMKRLMHKYTTVNEIEKLLLILYEKSKLVTKPYWKYEEIVEGMMALDFYHISIERKKQLINIINRICEQPIRLGKVHGDLHEDNILYDEKGKLYLIDFDCSQKNGIQAYDALYYVFEKERRKNGNISWLRFWMRFYEEKYDLIDKYKDYFDKFIDIQFSDIMVIFFVERLGKENKLGKIDHNRNEINIVLNKILLEK